MFNIKLIQVLCHYKWKMTDVSHRTMLPHDNYQTIQNRATHTSSTWFNNQYQKVRIHSMVCTSIMIFLSHYLIFVL